jgi:lysophospholipase L1-like esterase
LVLRKIISGLVVAGVLAAAPGAASAAPVGWFGGWEAAPAVADASFPNWSPDGFANQSVRQVVRVSKGGAAVRITVSNAYGRTPLRLTGATVGRAGSGAAVVPGSVRKATFRLSRSVEVPAGRQVVSDPIPVPVSALDKLSVTFYFAGATGPSTFHMFASATTYRAAGDHLPDVGSAAFGETSGSFYYLSAVDVIGAGRGTVVAFGDSITDGALSTVDADNRYPDELAERLSGSGLAFANAGIAGNRLLHDTGGFGASGVSRFGRDALGEPNVRTVIVLEGINDIAGSVSGTGEKVTADGLIAGYRKLISAAHARGVRVIGATIMATGGATYPGYGDPATAAMRAVVNKWIRTSGAFDAVVDFERVTADPADPSRLRPAYDSGDHIHPNDAGYHAMAAAIDPHTL